MNESINQSSVSRTAYLPLKMLLYCFPTTYPMLSEVKRLRGKTQLQYDLDQNKDNNRERGM